MRIKRSLLLLILVMLFSTCVTATESDKQNDIKRRELESLLEKIGTEEKGVLQTLFKMKQEIDGLERDKIELDQTIETLTVNIAKLESSLLRNQKSYAEKKALLKTVLQSYQQRGAGNFLGILLEAESISDFVRRLNTIRNFTKNSGELLSSIDTLLKNMKQQHEELLNTKTELNEKSQKLTQLIQEKKIMVEKNERYLASLKENRAEFEARLRLLDTLLVDVEKTLEEFTTRFNDYIADGYFPDELIHASLTLKGPRGSIEDKPLNAFIDSVKSLPKVHLYFYEDHVLVKSEEYHMELKGQFTLDGETKLKFIGEEGVFYGMPLEPSTISELSNKGYLILDFKPLIGNNTFKEVRTEDGVLQIYMKLKLF